MDAATVREKIADLAMLDGCELTRAQLDRLHAIFKDGYACPMPGWAFEMLRVETLDERVYKLGQMTRRVYLREFLKVGRTKIVRKK
jgi:hypothetical protein